MATPSNFTLQEATAAVEQGKKTIERHTCAIPGCSETFSDRSSMIKHCCKTKEHLKMKNSSKDALIAHLQTLPNPNRPPQPAHNDAHDDDDDDASTVVDEEEEDEGEALDDDDNDDQEEEEEEEEPERAGKESASSPATPRPAAGDGTLFRVAVTALQANYHQIDNAPTLVEHVGAIGADVHMLTEGLSKALEPLHGGTTGRVMSTTIDKKTSGHHRNVVLASRSFTGSVTSETHTLKLEGTNKCPLYYAAVLNVAGPEKETFVSMHIPGASESISYRYEQIKTAIMDTYSKYKSSSRFMMVMDANLNQVAIRGVRKLIAELKAQGLSVVQAGSQGRRKTCKGEYLFVFCGYEQVKSEEIEIPRGFTNHKTTAVHTFKRVA